MCIAGKRVEPGVGASGIRLLFPPVESLGALTRFKFWSLDDVSKPVKYLEKGVDIHNVGWDVVHQAGAYFTLNCTWLHHAGSKTRTDA